MVSAMAGTSDNPMPTPEPARAAAPEDFVELVDADGRTRWHVDTGFLGSRWQCLWGRGCQGIHDTRRPELADGCCSVGVRLVDEDEAMTIAALGATLAPAQLAHHGHPLVTEQAGHWHTTVVDGACVFFNPVGFAGGTGCALHLAALDDGDDPLDVKPQTCTRMPIRVEETHQPDGTTHVTVRAWRRDDWGPGGATMAWWCTEAPEAYTAHAPVLDTMAGELRVLLGDALYERVVEAIEPDR
jgi:hypothetical protein